ncbi:MAG: ATP-binding cassette domain-containing protein [Raoultibacter sp.]
MLEARAITFGYKKHAEPLYRDFNLQVASDERVALCAPSGFGKTTLCRMLAGYVRPQSGSILLDGEPLATRGVCPVQMVCQHPETVVDPRMRMRATLLEAGAVQKDLCEALGIKAAWMSRYPHELSGGELQRFCIVRALSANPRYLVADEISTMLDAVTQAHIWDFLVRETTKRGIGLVLVSHSLALTSRIATRVVTLVPHGL